MTAVKVSWRWALLPLAALKILLIVSLPHFYPVGGDFLNWVVGSRLALHYLLHGELPPVAWTGVYGVMFIVLAPFYWLWSAIQPQQSALLTSGHLPLSAAVSLSIVMKTPTFISDLAIALLISKLVSSVSPSDTRRGIAVLSWYANPFVIFWAYVFGAMDAIPTAIFLLGLYYGTRGRWLSSGFVLFVAGLLRVFALVTLPFLIFAIKSNKARVNMFLGAAIPFALFLGMMYATGAGSLGAIMSVPVKENWLDYFIGPNILLNPFLELTPLLLMLQFYAVARHWKPSVNLVPVACVSLLALLSGGSSFYAGAGYHFLWVTPLLSVMLGLAPEQLPLFLLFVASAYLTPPEYPFDSILPARTAIDPVLTAIFYATKAAYLIQFNLSNLRPAIKDVWLRIARTGLLHEPLIR